MIENVESAVKGWHFAQAFAATLLTKVTSSRVGSYTLQVPSYKCTPTTPFPLLGFTIILLQPSKVDLLLQDPLPRVLHDDPIFILWLPMIGFRWIHYNGNVVHFESIPVL